MNNNTHRGITRRRLLGVAGMATGAILQPVSFATGQGTRDLVIGIGEDGYQADSRQRIGYMPFNTNIFETLVTLAPDYTIQPGLATGWEFVAPSTWRFTLRPNVMFHDGTPFTAESVVWTMEHVASQGGGTIRMPAGATRAVDEMTVEITYPEPNMRLVEEICAPGIGSVLRAGTNPATERIGTGPFREVAYRPGQDYTVERNPDYWAELPRAPDRITFRFYPDPTTRLLALQAGEIDLNIEVDRQSAATVEAGGSARLLASPAGGYQALMINIGPNVASPAIRDLVVRKAILGAIDRQQIIDRAWLGNASGNDTLAPATIFGDAASLIPPVVFDRDAASAALDAAGYVVGEGGLREKDGMRLSFTLTSGYPTFTEHGAVAELIQAHLGEIGIEVTIVQIADRAAYGEALERGEGELWLEAAGQDDGNPAYLLSLFSGDSAWGTAFSPGPAFDVLYADAMSAPSLDEAQVAAAEAIKVAIADQAIVLPLAGFSRLWGATEVLASDVVPHPSRYQQRWTDLISPA